MPYAFRASATSGNSSSNGLNVTKPAGTADNDLLKAVCYLEGSSGSNTWTPPAGWAIAGSPRSAGTEFNVVEYWKLASGELTGACWVFTPASVNNWRTIVVGAYSGGVNPAFDVWSGSSGLAATGVQNALSVTTTAASDMVTFCYGNFGGVNPTSTVGAASTLRATLGGVGLAENVNASQGATGISSACGTGTQDYVAIHVGFKLGTAGAATTPRAYLRPWGIFG